MGNFNPNNKRFAKQTLTWWRQYQNVATYDRLLGEAHARLGELLQRHTQLQKEYDELKRKCESHD